MAILFGVCCCVAGIGIGVLATILVVEKGYKRETKQLLIDNEARLLRTLNGCQYAPDGKVEFKSTKEGRA